MSFENHPNAKKVYDYFDKKYSIGYLGVWHLYGIASIYLKEQKHILSSLIIADAGSYKSQVMKDFRKAYSNDVYMLPDQPTDRSLIKDATDNYKRVNNRLWTIDDAVTCFPTLDDARQKKFTNVFVRLIMDGEYSYGDFSIVRKELKARIGLYANVARETFTEVKSILKKTTFLDRTIPFAYSVDPMDEIRVDRNYRRGIDYGLAPKIKFKKIKVELPSELDDEFDVLRYGVHQNCEMSPSRASDWLSVILRSMALTEGRNKVTKEDLRFFRDLLYSHLSTTIPLTSIERALIRLVEMNPNATITDSYMFFDSEICKTNYPNDYVSFNSLPSHKLTKYLDFAKDLHKRESEVRDRLEKVNINVI